MFLHRVLPHPASNAPTTQGHHANVRRDSLQDNRIMTHDPNSGSPRPSKKSASPESPSLPSTFDIHAIPRADTTLSTDSQPALPGHLASDLYRGVDSRSQRAKVIEQSGEGDDRVRPTLSPSQVCLCQPDPKVPRPRNAFILFRQHHQAEVAKSNPGLANPEISKIIGKYWQHSSIETRIRWKNLAEEEKIRHQKQYPDYRYQPRRPGRGANASTSDGEPGKCPKCGNRSMTAPRLPSPIHENQAATTTPRHVRENPVITPEQHLALREQRPSPPSGMGLYTRGSVGPHYLNSPPPTMTQNRHPSRSSQNSFYNGSVSYSYGKAGPLTSPLVSPDAKRRRFDSNPVPYVPRTVGVSTPTYSHDRQPPLTASIRSETRPLSLSYPHPPIARSPARPNPSLPGLTMLRTGSASAQAKSVEAMIMSIPTLSKVRALAQLGRPLAEPGPTSPPYATRGSIVAVEGTDDEILKTVILHLRSRLQQNHEHRVKLFYGGAFAAKQRDEPSLADWLRLIQSWHSDCAEIRRFITTSPDVVLTPATSPTSPVPASTRDRSSTEPSETQETITGKAESSEMSSPKQNAPPNTSSRIGVDATDGGDSIEMRDMGDMASVDAMDGTLQTPSQSNPRKRRASDAFSSGTATTPSSSGAVPIAVIPRYQLTLTDVAASTIPIADEYSPLDHWHWVASMWRGIVGPDITIVLKSYPVSGQDDSSASDGAGNTEPKGRAPEVEVCLHDYRSIILRYEKGKKVSESALRRVGFEVEEWLRSREERGQRL